MASRLHYIKSECRNPLLLFLFLVIPVLGFSQKSKIDSLRSLLATEKTDSNRVKLMWQLARDIGIYNPDTAQVLSQQALYLARNIGYLEGESRSLGVLANTLIKIGNYPRALELNIQKLKLEEKRNVPRNFASVLMNIGVVYVLQDEYRKALEYYSKADSVIQLHNIDDLKYYITLNIGDVYNRLNISDSAFTFFNKSLELARKLDDGDLIGTSMTGLGHSYLKLGSYQQSLINYQTGIGLLKAANDDEILCEAALGIANLYEHLNNYDSAGYYATMSLAIAKQDGFLSKELEAAEFLTEHYKKIKSIDSAFIYVSYVRGLNDSVNSKSKIRESQVISSNEQYRQLEMEEIRRREKAERFQQLQMLLIAIFIPGFFLLTLLLSRINVPIKFIRLLGVISLLFLFEYLTLLLHPTVAKLTHHTPVYEILIFVVIAAILIPMHHRLEHWLIHKLTHHRHGHKVKTTPTQ
ncbi:MAG TPA: tetratricopeptide repeat protein [Chitinophagaceae bacterium]|nr:tetratricopeptide repeat protein [Chitinophagaceae bacterium]